MSILLFLLSVMGLVCATRRIEAKWHRQETQARLAAGLLVQCSAEARREQRRAARSCCHAAWVSVRARVWCCPQSTLQTLEEQVVYASLRARFIRPPKTSRKRKPEHAHEHEQSRRGSIESDTGSAMAALLQTHTDAATVDLHQDPGARLYRHKSAYSELRVALRFSDSLTRT